MNKTFTTSKKAATAGPVTTTSKNQFHTRYCLKLYCFTKCDIKNDILMCTGTVKIFIQTKLIGETKKILSS